MNHEKKIKAPTKKKRAPNTRDILDNVEDLDLDDLEDEYRKPEDVDESDPIIVSI